MTMTYTALDAAVDALILRSGTPPDDAVLTANVDTFVGQLVEVLSEAATTDRPAHAVIVAGTQRAKDSPPAVAAAWLAYINAIRDVDDLLTAATAEMVTDVERFLQGGDDGGYNGER